MNNFSGYNHTFVLCAYKDSPFLEECIRSLKTQTIASKIILVTSTPSNYIFDITQKYKIPVFINNNVGGISDDWNFGLGKADTDIVTIAHQDDIYQPCYTYEVLKGMNKSDRPLIAFTNYGELRNENRIENSCLLWIKRIMLLPLVIKKLQSNVWVRRRILSFGAAISCPTVSYYKPNLPSNLFEKGFKSDLDWEAWEKLSRYRGEFIYCTKLCMYHRIHDGSTTSQIIDNEGRGKEDYEMFCKFWPKKIARVLEKIYSNGEKSNSLKGFVGKNDK